MGASTSIDKENVLLGTLGALIGCAIGGILWTIVGYFGYFVFLIGLLIVFLGIKGYEKGAGKLSNKGLLIVGFISVLTALAATYVTWAYFLTQDYNQFFGLTGSTGVTIFEMLPVTHEVIFSDAELQTTFIGEIIMSLLFIILPTIFLIIQYNRELKAAETVRNDEIN